MALDERKLHERRNPKGPGLDGACGNRWVSEFDANLFTPVVVSQKLVFMTPEWKYAFRFTTELTSQKGLEMAIAASPGWSVTGGPWVKPEDAMKKLV